MKDCPAPDRTRVPFAQSGRDAGSLKMPDSELIPLGTKVRFGEFTGMVTAQAKYIDGSCQIRIQFVQGCEIKDTWTSPQQFHALGGEILENGDERIGFH